MHACSCVGAGEPHQREHIGKRAFVSYEFVIVVSILSLSTVLIDAALVPLQSFSLSNSKQASDPSASVVLRLRRTLF
jgi:hypothetical protein